MRDVKKIISILNILCRKEITNVTLPFINFTVFSPSPAFAEYRIVQHVVLKIVVLYKIGNGF